MYKEKLVPILNDIEDKEVEVAGGSIVGIVLSSLNSLITYICNLTIGKKKYSEVEDEVIKIKKDADNLKREVLEIIDKDKKILEEILNAYKIRRESPEEYIKINKEAVEFCLKVAQKALDTVKLAEKISEIGNKMLSSDFKICAFYGFASVESSIVNIKINLDSIVDEKYKKEIRKEYLKIYEESKLIKEKILKDYIV